MQYTCCNVLIRLSPFRPFLSLWLMMGGGSLLFYGEFSEPAHL